MINKTPNAVLQYSFLWGPYLALIADTLATVGPVVVTCADNTITIGTVTANTVTGVVTVILSGGNPGTTYTVNCQIKMTSGQYDDRSILVKVAAR